MKRLLFAFALLLAALAGPASTHAQVVTQVPDSVRFTYPPGDSVRILDSLYRARKRLLDKWFENHRAAAHPQEDFLSIYAGLGGYVKIRANDLNQYFSERVGRPDPAGDRENLSSIDRYFILAGQAQLARSWGIYVEYNFSQKDFNTIIDDTLVHALHGTQETMQLTQHSLVTGGMVYLLSSALYRLRANGGLGAAYVRLYEEEAASGATRSSTAVGYQFNFDLLNDFRFAEWGSFDIDFFSRSVSTGTLKTADGQTLQTPFGIRGASSLAPRASNLSFGFAAGVVFYF